MPKFTVKLTYKMSDFVEIEAPTEGDAILLAARKLMDRELQPSGKGEIQSRTAHIEPPQKNTLGPIVIDHGDYQEILD